MLVDGLELLQAILKTQGIQFLCWERASLETREADYGLRSFLGTEQTVQSMFSVLEQQALPGSLCVIRDQFLVTYFLFSLPEPMETARYFCIGPVLFPGDADAGLEKLSEELPAFSSYLNSLQEYYNRIPLFSSSDQLLSILCSILQKVFREEIRIVTAHLPASSFSPGLSATALHTPPQVTLSALEDRYRLEDAMLEAVAAGNTAQALQLHYAFNQHRIESRSQDALRDRKNLLFVLNTLLRKAVQKGAVHPVHIDACSRRFAIQIEQAASFRQLDDLSNQMIRRYCLLVQNYSMQKYSPLVQYCLNTIDLHFQEPLSLHTLANSCSVSASYLSGLFRKETGNTVTQYIHLVRVRHSLMLLNTTRLPVQEIAAACGFQDVNYFTRVFRQLQEKSPRQYREDLYSSISKQNASERI